MERIKEIIYEKILNGESAKIAKFADHLKDLYELSESDKEYVKEMQKKFEEANAKKYETQISKFSEVVLLMKSDEVFGEDTEVYLSSFYDDFKNGIDLITKISTFLFKSTLKEEKKEIKFYKDYQFAALGVDVTFGSFEALRHKMYHLKNEISDFSFTSVKYLPFKEEKEKLEIPHFIIYLPLQTLESLVDKFNQIKIPSLKEINLKQLKKEFQDIRLGYLPFAIYNQFFIQINFWEEKLQLQIKNVESNIEKLSGKINSLKLKIERIDVLRKKSKLLEYKNKTNSALINENKNLLNLKLKFNSFDFIKNHIKILIDNKISKEEILLEGKEKIKKEIHSINKDFAYNFLTEVKYNNKRFVSEDEIIRTIEKNIYLP